MTTALESTTDIALPKQEELCRHCRQGIAAGARKCHHCEGYQSRWSWFSDANWFLAFVMVLLTAFEVWMGVRLARIETDVRAISKAMGTLLVAQRVDVVQDDNSILLDYDPIPQSIMIIVGPLVHFPRANYGYKLDGRKLLITHDQTLEQVKTRIPSGGVTVQYIRKINLKNDTQPGH